MAFETLGLAALALYVVALVVVAEIARRARRDATPADHFLAGRELGTFVLFLTLYATSYSGNSMLGFPGEAYRRGFVAIVATAFLLAVAVGMHAVVPRLRPLAVAHGFVTPGDWVRHRFGRSAAARALTVAVALLMTVALANYLLAQLTAMGIVASRVTGDAVPHWAGVVGLAAMILYYETVGGMRAVAWTDAAQGLLMLGGLGALLYWLVHDAGGFAPITQRIAELRPELVRVPGAEEGRRWASTIVLLGAGSLAYPQLLQRIYAARSAHALRRSMALMSFMPLLTVAVVTLIGIAAIPRLEGLGGVAADSVMPRLLDLWAASGAAGTVLAVLVFVGALAAIMSTADSALLSMGSVIAQDVLGRPRSDPRTTRLGKRIAAGVMVAAVAVALAPRLTLWRLIELKMELLVQCLPAVVLALWLPGLRAGPVLTGLVVGTGVALAGAAAEVARVGGVHVGLLGLAANGAVVAAATALGRGPLRSGKPMKEGTP